MGNTVCEREREILPTGRHLVVVGSRAITEHIFHLQKLIRAIASYDGESKSLGALLQRSVVHLPVELAGVWGEAGCTPLTCAQRVQDSKCVKKKNRRCNGRLQREVFCWGKSSAREKLYQTEVKSPSGAQHQTRQHWLMNLYPSWKAAKSNHPCLHWKSIICIMCRGSTQ